MSPRIPRPLSALTCLLPLLLLLGLPADAATPSEASEMLRRYGRILIQAGEFDAAAGPPTAPADLVLTPDELRAVRYRLVHVRVPVTQSVRERIEATGARILAYVPNRAYLVRAGAETAAALEALDFVDWVGPFRPDWKLSPEIGRRVNADPDRPTAPHQVLLTLSLFEGEDPAAIAARADALGADVLHLHEEPRAPRVVVRVDRGGERALARIEGIEWIEEVGDLVLRNDTTRWVAQSNVSAQTPVWDRGIRGQNQIIGHIDSGIAESSCYFDDPDGDPPGPGHRKIVAYRGTMSAGSHGTHTAGTAAGLNTSGSLASAGMAYEARISHTRSSLISFSEGSLYNYLLAAHGDGARVHTNSWGDDGTTAYTAWCRDIDRFSRDYEESLVLFAVTNTSTLKTPENAKNVLAVGATRQAPSQAQHCTGGRGPTSDGRRKPEIYLPGCNIISASTSSCGTTSSSGTSMACPAVTGCAALVRQYYDEGFHPSGAADSAAGFRASAALVKATLLNGTQDMTGVAGYPSDTEGWGRLNLDNGLYFAGDARRTVIQDVRHVDGLSTGGTDEYLIDATNAMTLKITMVFTDEEAALFASLTPINDLDLEVEGPDGLFLGNVFSGGFSTTGGSPDNLNNVERVMLNGGAFTDGTWTVRVRGTSVPMGPQGYALHVSGDVQENTGVVGAEVVGRPAGGAVRLAQNRPNPFREATTIRVALPERNDVRLAIFDVGGRRVRTLAEGVLEAGDYTVDWDGRDLAGERAAAGIYFYRLEAGGFGETRKLVLLK